MNKVFFEIDKFLDDIDLYFSHTVIGADSIFRGLRNSLSTTIESYPPYNIIKIDENEYQIQFALAGFNKIDIVVTQKKNILTVSSKKQDSDKNDNHFYHKNDTIVYRGIATRSFDRAFMLAEYIKVDSVVMKNGLLTIVLRRVIPEEDQPREFKIK